MTTTATRVDPADLAFIVRFGRALHRYGASAPRLEQALGQLAYRLGVRGQFFSTPTAIVAGFGDEEDQRVLLVRGEPGAVDLEKLSDLHDLLNRIARANEWPRDAGLHLEEILARPARSGALVVLLAFAGASGAAARLLSGGLPEVLAAALVGLLTGGLSLWAETARPLARVFAPVAAVVAALAAAIAAHVAGPLSVSLTTLAGLIVLVPGLTLTVAMNELATRHIVSGTARLTGAITLLLLIALGVAAGGRIATYALGPAPTVVPGTLPEWTIVPALIVALLSFAVILHARPRDIGWVMFGGALAFIGAQGGRLLLGPEIGVAGGTFLLGVGSNLFARHLNRPTAVPYVPGLLLLVPGSIGFQGLAALLARDVLPGLDAAVNMLILAAWLVSGMILAGAVVPPRRAL